MKPIYFFSTRLRTYWVLAPMVILLNLCIKFNDATDNAIKLYPLIVCSVLAIAFTILYLFRVIELSYSSISYIGPFSSKDSVTITEGKTLVIDMLDRKKIAIKLYGNEGYNPDIKWLQNDDGTIPDICLFRGKTYGDRAPVIRILKYFDVDAHDFDDIFSKDGFEKSYENVTVTSLTELEHRQIKIRIDHLKTDNEELSTQNV